MLSKLKNSKKGFNDAYLLIFILALLVSMNLVLSYLSEDLNGSYVSNSGGIDANETGIVSFLTSLRDIFFWNYSGISIWIQTLILLPLRVGFYFIVLRNIIGGGS